MGRQKARADLLRSWQTSKSPSAGTQCLLQVSVNIQSPVPCWQHGVGC